MEYYEKGFNPDIKTKRINYDKIHDFVEGASDAIKSLGITEKNYRRFEGTRNGKFFKVEAAQREIPNLKFPFRFAAELDGRSLSEEEAEKLWDEVEKVKKVSGAEGLNYIMSENDFGQSEEPQE